MSSMGPSVFKGSGTFVLKDISLDEDIIWLKAYRFLVSVNEPLYSKMDNVSSWK